MLHSETARATFLLVELGYSTQSFPILAKRSLREILMATTQADVEQNSVSQRASRTTRWSRRYRQAAALAALLSATWMAPAPRAQTDSTPPALTSRSPAPGATGVSALVNLRALFSEAIQPATLTMELRTATNQLVAAP